MVPDLVTLSGVAAWVKNGQKIISMSKRIQQFEAMKVSNFGKGLHKHWNEKC